MSRYESWQDVLDDTCERLRGSGTLQSGFKALASNTDRILFCLQEPLTQSRVDEWLQVLCCARHKKYWEKAFELRSEGNLCFGAQRYREAVEYYTRSILAAPFPTACIGPNHGHSEELALSFANRSAAWFYLGKFSLALRDIHQAILQEYPANLRYKLHLRQAQCLLKTGSFEAARAALTDAEMALDLSGLDEEKLAKQSREIEMLTNKCSSKIPVEPSESDTDEDVEEDELVQPSPHSSIPNASSSLDSLYSTEKGRFIVANREIRPGDNLFVERPYASVLLPAFAKTHCHHCYRRIRAAYPCQQCSQVRYCSPDCAQSSWEAYHRSECGYLDLLTSVGIAHLAERVVLTTGLGLLEDFMKSRNSLECNYLPVYQLVTHEDEMHIEDLFQYSLTATLLLKFLERHTSFFTTTQLSERVQDLQLRTTGSGSSSGSRASLRGQIRSECGPQLKLFVGGLLLRHIQQLICNAHAITTIQQPGDSAIKEDGVILEQEQVRVATAIYPSASLMNHSCEPNITSGFRFGSTLVVKAVCSIAAGEEVFNCYGPHFRRMTFQERQTALLEQYFFRCDCTACRRGDVDDQILMAFRCGYCEGPLSAVESSGKAECLQCHTMQDCLERERKAFCMHDLFVQGVQLADIESYEEALDRLQRCLAAREKLLYRHNKQLMETRDMIAKCFCALQRFRDAAAPLKLAIESVRYVYGNHSIEFGNELLKYGDVLMNATQECFARNGYCRELATLVGDTKRVLLQTEPIFLLHYGKAHPAIRELKDKRVKLDQFISRFKANSASPRKKQ